MKWPKRISRSAQQRRSLLAAGAAVAFLLTSVGLRHSVPVGVKTGPPDAKWNFLLGLNMTSTLQGLGILSTHENCFVKMMWNGTGFISQGDEFEIICHENKAAMSVRLRILQSFLSRVFLEMNLSQKWGFILDVTDATRNHRDLFERLNGTVVAGIGKGTDNKDVFLLPDPYMIAGVAYNEHIHGVLPADLKGFGRYLSPTYDAKTLNATPWAERQSKLVYRGSCHPTIDASATNGHHSIRGEFCTALQHQERIDFKLRTSETQECLAAGAALFESCLPCCSNSSLKVTYMAQQFRYQLILDGYGPSYESGIWKSLSCGTIFKGEHSRVTRLELFWNQFLEEGVDFLAVFPDTVLQEFENCQKDEHRCQAIAERGCKKMASIVSWDFMTQFTKGVARQMNDLWYNL